MTFQDPKVEVVNIEANANVFAAGSCVSDASANPSFQSCSVGSAHEASCMSEADDWVD